MIEIQAAVNAIDAGAAGAFGNPSIIAPGVAAVAAGDAVNGPYIARNSAVAAVAGP